MDDIVRSSVATANGVLDVAQLRLRDYRPRSMARTVQSRVDRPAHPVVDAHNHLGRWLSPDGSWLVDDVPAFVAMMDELSIETVVNLDGRWGDELEANLARYDRAHPGRFATFCHLDWSAFAAGGVAARLVEQVELAHRAGARGIKIWKDLGLSVLDRTGSLVAPDDPRLVPALRRAGELAMPVLIHTADPVAFFEPRDVTNERIEELADHPDWWFGRPGHPTFDALISAMERLVAACPETSFVGAHVGGAAEDLARVGRMLRSHGNLSIDLGGRMAELGRRPRAVRRLIVAHPDRVLFGTDAYPPTSDDYRLWFRFLETDDECFDYAPGEPTPPQGRWQVAAVDLPPTVLGPVYRDNARRLLAGE